jgi:hypothetical protein
MSKLCLHIAFWKKWFYQQNKQHCLRNAWDWKCERSIVIQEYSQGSGIGDVNGTRYRRCQKITVMVKKWLFVTSLLNEAAPSWLVFIDFAGLQAEPSKLISHYRQEWVWSVNEVQRHLVLVVGPYVLIWSGPLVVIKLTFIQADQSSPFLPFWKSLHSDNPVYGPVIVYDINASSRIP